VDVSGIENRKFTQGQEVELVISADILSLSTDQIDGHNAVRCTIVSEEFIGTVITLLVETDDGVELKIQKQQRDVDQFDLESDTALWASWSPQDVYILP
jgi:spermidine/putrescine transport system ATP-binding protein